jgi:uncharacterized protein with ParB-like and HNH nuclease domain
MKFSDIKPFTRDGDYEVNIGLKYLETTLKDYEESYGLELNPDFQRGHVWTEDQQIAFVEFFLKGGKTARVMYFNCPSFSRSIKENDSPMVCVDGLQRLTALRRFLNNEIKVFGLYLDDFEDKDIMLRKIGNLRFNINNLQTKKEVLQWYLDFNTGGTVHSKEEIERVEKLLEEEKQNE